MRAFGLWLLFCLLLNVNSNIAKASGNIDKYESFSGLVDLADVEFVKELEVCANAGGVYCSFALGRSYIHAKTIEEQKLGISWLEKTTALAKKSKLSAVMAARKLLKFYSRNVVERKKWVEWLVEYGYSFDKIQWSRFLFSEFRDVNVASHSYHSVKEAGDEPFTTADEEKFIFYHDECVKGNHTSFYGAPLACSYRGELALALAENKVAFQREDYNYFYDKYDGSSFHKEASVIYIGYVHDYDPIQLLETNRFARMVVKFPSSVDVEQIMRIKRFLAGIYGEASSSKGQTDIGNVEFTWNRPDDVQIVVSRDNWPDTSVLLTIEYVPLAKILSKQIEGTTPKKERVKSPLG